MLGLVSGNKALSEICREDLLGTGRFAEDLDGTIGLGVVKFLMCLVGLRSPVELAGRLNGVILVAIFFGKSDRS